MKIIKNGKRNCGAFKFKCDKCGCKFEADASDYIYVNKSFDFDIDKFINKPTENNTPSDTIECECPNCGNKVIKNIYKGSTYEDNNKGLKVFNLIGITLGILTLIYVGTHGKDDDLGSALLVLGTIIYNFLHTIHIYDEYQS